MSKEVDERVVSMQFDNKHFESNVKTSMSTIDKLKQSLNFKGAEKGLNNVTASTRKMVRESQSEFGSYKAGIFSITDAINKMWSVMEYEVAHKMKNAFNDLTITPLKTGLQEYETQLNAVQTILANTESKGATLNDVNAALDELNKYADLTIYNFTEMTRNIGTFTAAGVGLKESVSAIKGIANLAAVSGSNPQQAATAMYQLSQAISSGTVRLMDWNSVVNAGMGGQVFQDALKETARVHGVAIDDMIEKEGSFRDSLSKEWLTSDILTETLEHFTMAAEKGSKEWNEFKKSLMDDGYTEEQAEAILKMANTATDAATKVKTFTQLVDVTKEAIQSGWAQTFEILIGDFEQAKEIWTSASDVITGFVGKMNDARNTLLQSAFGKGFTQLTEGLEDVLDITKKVTDPINKTVDALEDLGVIVDKVIIGDFGNGRERYARLTEAGYNYFKVQNKVNEKLGDAHRYTDQQIADQDKLLSGTKKTTEATEEKKDETVKLTKEQKEQLKNLVKMDEAELKNLNLTNEQIDALNELRKTAEKLGIPLDEFIDNLDKINGRWLWIQSFKNIGNSLIAIFKSIGKAWTEIFDPITADGVFNALGGFHKITSDILHGIEKNAENLTRIFKGVFAVVDIIATLFGSTLKLAFQAANAVLSAFGTDVLSVMAWLADGIVVVRDWIDAHNPIIWLFRKLGEALKRAVEAWKTWTKGLKEAENPGKYIIDGLINGISSGLKKLVSKAKEIATTVIETVKDWLGIHSPSTVFIAIGGFIIAGLVIGIKNGIGILGNLGGDAGSSIINGIVEAVKAGLDKIKQAANWVGEFLKERFSGFNFGSITSMLGGAGLIVFLWKISEFIGALSEPISSLGDFINVVKDGLDNIVNFTENISKTVRAAAFDLTADAIFRFAKSLLILVGSVIVLGIAFAYLPDDAMWKALGMIGALIAALAVLTVALSLLNKATFSLSLKDGLKTGINTTVFVIGALGTALLGLAAATWLLGKVNWNNAGQIWTTLGGFLVLLFTTITLLNKLPQKASGKQILATALIINSITLSMLVLSASILVLSLLPTNMLKRGTEAVNTILRIMGTIVVLIAAIALITNIFNKNQNTVKNITNMTGMFFDIGIAMLLLAATIAILGHMDEKALWRGVGVVAGFLAGIAILVALFAFVSAKAKTEMIAVGGIFAALGFLVLSITLFLGIAGLVKWERALSALGGLALVIAAISLLALIIGKFSSTSDTAFKKGAGTIIGIGVALLSIATAMLILSIMSTEAIAKAIAVITAIGLVLAVLTGLIGLGGWLSKGNAFAKGAGVFIGMGIAILAIAGSLLIISMIPVESLIIAASVLRSLMIVFGVMNWLSKGVQDTGKSMMYMAIVIGALAVSLAVLSMLNMGKVYAAVGALSAVMLVLSGVIKSTKNIGDNAKHVWQIAILIGVIAGAIALLCLFSPGQLTGAVLAITIMSVIVGALMLLCEKMNNMTISLNLGGIIKTLLKVLAVVAVLGLVVWALSSIPNPWNAVAATLAMGILVAAMVGLAASIKLLSGINLAIVGKGLLILAAIAGGVGLIAVLFAGLAWAALAMIGDGLTRFWKNAEPFMDGIKSMSPESALGAKYLAETCLALAGASALTTLTSIFGGTNFGELGIQLQEFGKAMVDFSTTVAGKINEDAITAASNAGTLLIDMAAKLPKTGGVVQFFTGEAGNLATFGTQLVSFGNAMVLFSSTVAGRINEDAITAAANAGSIMLDLQNKLPKTGGVVQFFTGEQDLGLFATNIGAFGKAIVSFSKTVSGNINESAVLAAANAGNIMAELQNKLPETSWFKKTFTGQKDLANFSANLPTLATAIVNFSNNLKGLNVQNVTAASGAIAEITKIGKINSKDLGNTVTQVDKLIDLCNGMGLVNLQGMGAFGTALKAVADNGIKAFIQSFTDSTTKATNAVNTLITTMITNLDAGYAGFATSGAYVGEGFVNGVENKKQAAYNAGYALGLAAKQGTKDATKQNSPSKVFYGLGGFCVDGYVNAFIDNQSRSYAAGSDMANSTVKGLSKALSHVQDVIDSDMDVQPTIRPVLDLSDIESGVGHMNGLLNANPSVGVEANISAIRRLQNNQNGVNLNDVVSAIDKLYDKEIPTGDIYQVNGVTYDDGSNIAEAIATIVRAAIVERRT